MGQIELCEEGFHATEIHEIAKFGRARIARSVGLAISVQSANRFRVCKDVLQHFRRSEIGEPSREWHAFIRAALEEKVSDRAADGCETRKLIHSAKEVF